jgi:hypothetical protein
VTLGASKFLAETFIDKAIAPGALPTIDKETALFGSDRPHNGLVIHLVQAPPPTQEEAPVFSCAPMVPS